MRRQGQRQVRADAGVTLLWLESASSGTASQLHLQGTLERLRAASLPVRAVISSDEDSGEKTVRTRAKRLAILMGRGMFAGRRGVLFARFHPFLLPVLFVWRLCGGVSIVSVQGALDHVVMDGVPLARLWALVSRWTLNRADGVVTVTEGLADSLRRRFSDPTKPLVVVPNGIAALSPAVSEAVPVPDYPYAVFVGNLATWQGIDRMLAAVDHPEWPEDLRFVVIGDGSQAGQVKRCHNPLVIPLGRQPLGVAQAWLANAVVSISFQDPKSPAGAGGYWPFKILEAAMAGVPSVVSDAKGLPGMARQLGSCLVRPYDDVRGLAEAVAEVHSSPSLRRALVEAGRTNVERFTWPAESGRLASFIEEVLMYRCRDIQAPASEA